MMEEDRCNNKAHITKRRILVGILYTPNTVRSEKIRSYEPHQMTVRYMRTYLSPCTKCSVFLGRLHPYFKAHEYGICRKDVVRR